MLIFMWGCLCYIRCACFHHVANGKLGLSSKSRVLGSVFKRWIPQIHNLTTKRSHFPTGILGSVFEIFRDMRFPVVLLTLHHF